MEIIPGGGEIVWVTSFAPMCHCQGALPVTVDGAFHDYRLPVGANRNWRGRINHLRFDPAQSAGLRVTIESVKMAK